MRVKSTKTGLTAELDSNIFDLGERSSADLMRTTQIKIAQYIGSLYGGDTMGKLDTKTEFFTPSPTYPPSAEARRPAYENMIRSQQAIEMNKLMRKRMRVQAQIDSLDASVNVDAIEALEEQLSDVNTA